MKQSRHHLAALPPLLPTAFIAACVLAAAFGELLAPHDAYALQLNNRLQPATWMAGGSPTHLLGTDQLGRDTLSRIIVGARASVIVGIVGVLAGSAIGTLVGIVSGFIRGVTDAVLMRFVDAFLGVPIILFAVLLAISIGPGLETVIIASALALWARTARVVRSEVLSLRERPFVEAARAVGLRNGRLMRLHVLPNLWGVIITLASLQVGTVVLFEASLSFLGAGIPPPTPAWGSMIAAGRLFFDSAWWVSTFPGVAVFLLVLSTNLLGDWVRDRLDPTLRI